MNDGLWDWDIVRNTVYYSPLWKTILGYAEGELGDSPTLWKRLIHPDDLKMAADAMKRHLGDPRIPYCIVLRFLHKNGSVRYLFSRGEAIRDMDGKAVRMIGGHTDVTALQSLGRKEAYADAAQSHFLANMCHEIKTPLSGVISVIELLEGTEISPRQRQYLSVMQASGNLLLDIVGDLLDLSKLEAGQMTLEYIGFDLAHLCRELVEMMRARSGGTRVEILLIYPPNLPTRFRCDPTRIRQVLINFLSNAVKFTAEGDIRLHVSGWLEADGRYHMELAVEDTGIGIVQEKQETIFDKFTQADRSTTRQYGGTGLGLTICKEIAGLLGGRIEVTSTPGKGSRFTLHLPLDVDADAMPAIPPVHTLQKVRILVVDGNDSGRAQLGRQIGEENLPCAACASAEEALGLLREAAQNSMPFGIVIISCPVSDLDAGQLACTIRSDRLIAATKLVVLASHGRRGDAARMREAGFAAYLQKPVEPAQLLHTLAAVWNIGEDGRHLRLVTRHTLAEAQAVAMHGSTSHQPCRGLHVLVAEDNPTNQQVIGWLLEDIGCSYVIAQNGLEAVEQVRLGAFDLVLMDCQMPSLDGLDATRRIREQERGTRRIPIIALTADAMREDCERCLQAGMDDYIGKPVRLQELMHKMQRFAAVRKAS